MPNPNAPQSRRTFLKRGSATVAGSAIAGGLPALALGAEAALGAGVNPIVDENTGTPQSSWSTSYRVQTPSTIISGYTRRSSVNLGEPIELVACGPNKWLPEDGSDPLESIAVEMYRLGYYGGKGARLVWSSGNTRYSTWQLYDAQGNPANGGSEPAYKPNDPSTGLVGVADWKTTMTIPGSAATVSGVYLIKLKGQWYDYPPNAAAVQRSGESHAIVIVRDDNRPRDLLAVLPTNTWQAYNYWSGRSLYTYSSRYNNNGSIVSATGTERAAKVSLDRPYNNWLGDYNWVLRTEFPAIWWFEQQGYDVAYTDDVGLHFNPGQALPAKSKAVAILGHGEYWTQEIRDAVQNARDAGTSIYNFGANCGYWRVRYETTSGQPATSQADARVLVCYKTIEGGGTAAPNTASKADPVSPTTTWRDPGKGSGINPPGTTYATPTSYTGPKRPEAALFGVQYIGDDDNKPRPLTVPAGSNGEFAAHPAWRNAGIPSGGTSLGTTLLGWEWDGVPPAGDPFGAQPLTKSGTSLKRLTQSDPRINSSGTVLTYITDGGRIYSAQGSSAQPPANGTPYAHAITYTAPSGALVFSSGTIHWSWGLGPHHLDTNSDSYTNLPVDSTLKAIQQATTNLLVDGGVRPATPNGVVVDGGTTPTTPGTTPTTPPPTTPTTPPDTTAPTVTVAISNTKSWFYNAFVVSKTTRTLTFKVTCPSTETSGPVSLVGSLQDAAGVLGSVTGSVQPGATATLNLVIGATEFKRLTSKTTLATTLTVTATDAAGNGKAVSSSQRLRAQ